MSISSTSPPLHHSDQTTLPLSSIIFGAATFSACYSDEKTLESTLPEQTLLHALRSGINAIDTSPYYTNSEMILGKILSKPEIRHEFPRSSYHILTKCGRYGSSLKDFDYTPDRLRKSIDESCDRLNTTYLDAVYLHDVEFVAEEEVGDDDDCKIASDQPGAGDLVILEAAKTLFDLKSKGQIKNVGISGYPLPTLLRLSKLISKTLNQSLDLVMSYAHYTLQNDTLKSYTPQFQKAGVRQLINASPLCMGLLRSAGPMPWHPAPPPLREACAKASEMCLKVYETTLERVALGFGLEESETVPVVVGFSKVEEVKECLKVRNELFDSEDEDEEREMRNLRRERFDEMVREIRKVLMESGYMNWSWSSTST